MSDHSEHDPSVRPIEGCPECDKYVNRPIPLGYGGGKSSVVVERPKPPQQ